MSTAAIVDVWMDYKRLRDEEGWTQQQIADAKGVNRTNVALRLTYADFPQSVFDEFVTSDFLTESHAREIRQLLHCNNLSPWITRETAMLEVLNSVIDTSLPCAIIAPIPLQTYFP